MPYRATILAGVIISSGLITAVVTSLHSAEPSEQAGGVVQAENGQSVGAKDRVSVDEARRQAKLLQNTYEATLHVMHRRYFDADEKVVIPARALEDIFALIDEETGGTTRWIAVNTPAMNVDHEPSSDFEKQAAAVLTEGEREHEAVIDGMYHRAGAVTLFGSCLKCHLSALTKQVQKERVAALVVSLPVREE